MGTFRSCNKGVCPPHMPMIRLYVPLLRSIGFCALPVSWKDGDVAIPGLKIPMETVTNISTQFIPKLWSCTHIPQITGASEFLTPKIGRRVGLLFSERQQSTWSQVSNYLAGYAGDDPLYFKASRATKKSVIFGRRNRKCCPFMYWGF